MTPLIFISFLVSLALVDLRYSAMRSHYHPDPDTVPWSGPNDPHQTGSGRLPSWLHKLLFRYRPYRYEYVSPAPAEASAPTPTTPGSTNAGEKKTEDGDGDGDDKGRYHGGIGIWIWGDTYYRTKQRKLIKMEAADAFEIRSTVLAVLGLLGICFVWGAWRVFSWGFHFILSKM